MCTTGKRINSRCDQYSNVILEMCVLNHTPNSIGDVKNVTFEHFRGLRIEIDVYFDAEAPMTGRVK